MSEQTLPAQSQAPAAGTSLRPPRGATGRGAGEWWRHWPSSYRWLGGALAVIVLAALVVAWARVRPGFDPYGWLVWGHLTLHGTLNTDGAPSWKPLPFIFTLPYNLVGRDAVYLWMTTAVAVSLAGFVFAYRLAYRLVAPHPERRWAGHLAGLVAAGSLLDIYRFMSVMLSAQSDTMVIALCLAAADCILCRRYRWAFWAWWLAALGRPEAWSLLGLYSLWAWREIPAMRRQIAIGLLLVPLAWFGIPGLTSKSPFTPATLANNSKRVIHGNKITGTIGRFLSLTGLGIKLAGLIAVGMAAVRRDRRVLWFTAGMLVWIAVETAFALHGWSAVRRYLMEPGAGLCVLAGVFAGRVILDAPSVLRRLRLPASPRLAGLAGLAVVAVFMLGSASSLRARLLYERDDLRVERIRTGQLNLLAEGIARIGAARIIACGQPAITLGRQSALAWDLGTNVGVLFYVPASERHHPHPIVVMQGLRHHGWHIYAAHTVTPAQAARCRGIDYRI